mgnify:CR=1 FL=1
MFRTALAAAFVTAMALVPAQAGPQYDQSPEDLEWVMAKLKEWLPGEWSAYPQVHYERTVRMPEEGEHDNWYRTFALIDAPQVGETVFYGQINVDKRSGGLMGRTQIVYTARIDEERGAVVMNGQPPADAGRFIDLQDKPELWSEVPPLDMSKLHCDFLWRRDGDQLFAVLEGQKEEYQKYGFGTCNYMSEEAEAEFFADAEWVLTPETLWIYDINTMGGQQFIGREDRTHVRLSRSRPYSCAVSDANGARTLNAYDRGFETEVAADGGSMSLMLLRAEYPDDDAGLEDQLKLMLLAPDSGDVAAETVGAPEAEEIELAAAGVTATCSLQQAFPPLSEAD